MLNFKPIRLEDKSLVEKYYGKENHYLCEYYFSDIYMWSKTYHTKIAEHNGYLYLKMTNSENVDYFFAPEGEGDFIEAVNALIDYTNKREIPLLFTSIYAGMKEKLENAFPDKFSFEENRDNSDYIYLAEKLINLSGKKLHKKKNHLNRFLKEYDGRWTYEDLDDDNKRDFFQYQLKWCDIDNEFLGELGASSLALRNYNELNMKGGILKVDGEIIAVTLGSRTFEDTFVIHIEKAETHINGSYQAINNMFASRNCQDVKYIDREEDLGIPGLRKAKESYYPEFLPENYIGKYIG